ncbi:hypothetical protein GGTG_12410 [Gaeumannomyces tritici R3-111a-1]|uniref:Major facilitator superfamily (MFS) profile domain-containing protein n=1 Tax=Gaeumannomyces tritici (strain R3-111a-1) TaxID=644352 RepID=J3PFY5_GAET3|nr:hypothetical protein GGTG_12410 [Gaeumannomyces tritici R3-111a-1]EJT70237.1 hypothetical protein GGTG_12410 [Gaeumannomyces tritici R3-111a-1]
MREVQRPGRVYTYRPPGSSEGLAYLDSGSEIHLTRLWSVPTGQFPDAPPYYWEGDPPPLENLPASDDPADWRTGKKAVNIGLVAVFAFITSLTSAIFAPAALELKGELGAANQALGELSLSIFVLGGALGALAAAPASESWGRAPVYWLSDAAFAGLTAAPGGGGGDKKKGGRNNEWLLRGYVVFSPVAGALAAYTAVLFGCFYLLLASLPFVFGSGGGAYEVGERSMQLSYLGVGAGALLGLAYYVYAVKRDARRLSEEREAGRRIAPPPPPHPTPEDRLRPLRLSALSVPIGFAIYGWTASAGAHWVLPVLGLAAAGFGVAGVFAAAQLYLVEAFPGFPASAVASNVMLRSLTAGGLPMAGPAMFGALGVGWCGTVLAVVAFGLVPVPWLVVRYGGMLRRKFAPYGL